jgi:branched-chain amino acid aminotransferase
LGDGAFETLAVFNGAAIDLSLHIDRLMNASGIMGLALARADVENGAAALLQAHRHVNAVMRITASRGAGIRGLAADGISPSLLITISPWVKGTLNQPVSLITSGIRRNETSPASRLKLLSYADNILAAREAMKLGAGDAMMLNKCGHIACTTVANIVLVKDGTLFTPPSDDGALPGIIRKHIGAQPKTLLPSEVFEADGVFLTNSLRLVRPVTCIDNRPLSTRADAQIAAVFVQQCRRIEVECGRDPRTIDTSVM